jgi:hypothetical protein
LNGGKKDREFSPVTTFDRQPTVMIFARVPAEKKEGAIGELLKKLDEAVEKYQEEGLRSCIVYLSPDARSSATDPKTTEPAKLVEEARARMVLKKKLEGQAKDLKNVLVTIMPDGPKGFDINPQAGVTVLFYDRLKVLANIPFAEGKVRPEDADMILQQVRQHLAPKAAAEKKSKG